ncbi:hypothetical protein [Pseudoalteromonas umbrosa]|uniref:hypothetical protein n=1 Tax=Pseudoalteromonas umbrosa TaxID=3048489 RepID=UPI0024C2319F|nr:hypothetical protein [Pseudoalteromonas sp. B95]MDK1290101.1 hypothetical protein [Pseudoalteromonas sp. B95]
MVKRSRSRKHLLAQQSPKSEAISRRLTVRIPKKLHTLLTDAVADEQPKISRNKYVSDAVVRLRERHVVSRLELPLLDDEGNQDMTADEMKLVDNVNKGVAILAEDTKLISGESVSLPIRFTDEGVAALQDLITRVRTQLPEDSKVFEKIKTIFIHIALWDKVMDGKSMEELNAQSTN